MRIPPKERARSIREACVIRGPGRASWREAYAGLLEKDSDIGSHVGRSRIGAKNRFLGLALDSLTHDCKGHEILHLSVRHRLVWL